MDGQLSFQTQKSKMVKIGYARIVDGKGYDTYISYRELSYYSDVAKERLRKQLENGEKRMYCACCQYDDLELTITQSNVIRVKKNGMQERHLDSCPKSIRYGAWVTENMQGTSFTEDADKIIFNITLPGVGGGSTSSSISTSSSDSASHKAALLDMVRTLNAMAWEKQTYSKKKEIAASRKENRPSAFQYKNCWEFSQLIYGISNEIYVQYGSNISAFSSLFYRKNDFYNCMDFRRRFFVYAEIERISPYKAERKYQYITLRMPSNKSGKKTTVRVATDKFLKMIDADDIDGDGKTRRILAGWVNHSIYTGIGDGSQSEWMTLLKGIVFYVSENGLYAETPYVAQLIDALCGQQCIFKRPYVPLESFQNTMPTLIVEVRKGKDIIVDVTHKENIYEKHTLWGEENQEYECHILRDGEDYDAVLRRIQAL